MKYWLLVLLFGAMLFSWLILSEARLLFSFWITSVFLFAFFGRGKVASEKAVVCLFAVAIPEVNGQGKMLRKNKREPDFLSLTLFASFQFSATIFTRLLPIFTMLR